jgi:hypothetical protein
MGYPVRLRHSRRGSPTLETWMAAELYTQRRAGESGAVIGRMLEHTRLMLVYLLPVSQGTQRRLWVTAARG